MTSNITVSSPHYLRPAPHWPQSWSVPAAAAICSPFWPFLGHSCLLSVIIQSLQMKKRSHGLLKNQFHSSSLIWSRLHLQRNRSNHKSSHFTQTSPHQESADHCTIRPSFLLLRGAGGQTDIPGMTQPFYLGRRFPKWWETNIVLQSQLFENSFLWPAVKCTCKHIHSSISMAQLRLKFQVPQNIPLIKSAQICVTSCGQPEFTEIAFHDTLWSLKIAHH